VFRKARPPSDAARSANSRGLRGAAIIAFIVAPLLAAISGLLMFGELRATRAQQVLIEHSFRTREQVQRVFSLMQDAETGQRGYVITGQADFLEPYSRAVTQIDLELVRLEVLAAEIPDQRPALLELRRHTHQKLREMGTVITIRDREGAAAAFARVAEGRGKTQMDVIRTLIEQLRTASDEHLHRQQEIADRRAAQTYLVAAFGLLLLGASIIVAALLVVSQFRLRQRLSEEREQETIRHRAIFENSMDALVILNPSGSIEQVNPAADRMFGYAPGELERRDASVIAEIAPGEGVFLRRLALRGSPALGASRELTGRRSNGETFPAEVVLGAMRLADGVHVVAAIRDISERKAAERAQEEFVSTVSHELRTPLTSISGSLGLMQGGAAGEMPERAHRLIQIAKTSCDRLVRLINDLLDIQKMQSGRIDIRPQPLDLRDVAVAARDALSSFAGERGTTVIVDFGPPAAPVMGDFDRLVQVTVNLLSNAIKFSPPEATVQLTIGQTDHDVTLRVCDEGPGVPEQFQPSLFRRFAQADGSHIRAVGGSGLGLAISREIVERHGGAIGLEQTGVDGSIFLVRLPRSAHPTPRAEAPAAATNAALPSILHIDDDAELSDVIAAALDKVGRTVGVRTVKAARTWLVADMPDLVILDIDLPDGSGADLLPELVGKTPVIVYSGQDLDGLPLPGVEAVLIKSRVSFEQLTQAAEALIRRDEREDV
jgi:PAS domain S-box-containing protein